MRIVERCGEMYRVWSTVSDSYYHEPMSRSDMEATLVSWGWNKAEIQQRINGAEIVDRWAKYQDEHDDEDESLDSRRKRGSMKCRTCENPADTFRDELSKREHAISGMKSNPFTSHRADLIFVLDQIEWCFGIIDAALESQERLAKEVVEYRQKTLQTYEHNAILVRERDVAIALREDAEEKAEMFEVNHAGQLKRLRERTLSLESALRVSGQRIEELVGERDARANISVAMARESLEAKTTIEAFDVVIGALREHVTVVR